MHRVVVNFPAKVVKVFAPVSFLGVLEIDGCDGAPEPVVISSGIYRCAKLSCPVIGDAVAVVARRSFNLVNKLFADFVYCLFAGKFHGVHPISFRPAVLPAF